MPFCLMARHNSELSKFMSLAEAHTSETGIWVCSKVPVTIKEEEVSEWQWRLSEGQLFHRML